MDKKIPNGPVVIIFCRHLDSKICRKELHRLWSKISVNERHSHQHLLIFGAGKPESVEDWRDYLGDSLVFIEDHKLELFARFGLYSGIVVLASSGSIVRKMPLNLLETIAPVPFDFLRNQ